MSQTIKLKRSAVAGKVPTTSSLDLGEIALNTNDGKAYLKKNDGSESIQTFVVTDSLTTGSIVLTGQVSASVFSGSFFGNGTGLTRNMAVTGSDVLGNQFEDHVSVLHFDSDTGINVSASAPNTAFIKLGSHFRDFFVDGSATIVATGSDQMDIIANGGLDISTSLTDTNGNGVSKELIFAVDATVARTGSNTFTADQTIEGKVTSSTLDTSGNAIIRGDLDVLGDINITGEIDGHISVTPVASDSNNSNGVVIQDLTFDGFGHTRTLGTVNLDDRYFTETEADNRFVNVTGDSISGSLVVSASGATNDFQVGDSKLFVSASGKVGIGTTSPSHKLTVADNASFAPLAKFENTGTGQALVQIKSETASILELGDSADGNVGAIQYFHTENSMRFKTADNERMRITSSGNVGIGTTSPSAILEVAAVSPQIQFTDTVNASAYSRILATDAGGLIIDADKGNAGTSSYISIRVDDSEKMLIDSSGNVGIGTTSPSKNLHVYHATTNRPARIESGDSGAQIEFTDNSTTNLPAVGAIGDDFVIQTGGSSATRMLVDNSGNVGIGTSSPSTRVEIDGVGNANTVLRITNTGASTSLTQFEDANTTTRPRIGSVGNNLILDTANTERMRIDSSGNVLVGKTTLSNADAGIELNSTGQLVGTFASGTHILGRNTDDGAILTFNKDNTAVGFIGTYAGTLFVSNGDTGLQYNGAADQIRPCNASGEARDNAIDLGDNTRRFKDLYLGGTGYIDGDLTVGGIVTAQEFHTEFVSASIIYQSGSTKFGDTSDDVHSFSGSLRVTGSGDHYFTNGNVGIGTTSPAHKLDLSDSSTTWAAKILNTNANGQGLLVRSDTTNDDSILGVYGNGSYRMIVKGDGNVGIGTTSPDSKLHVSSGDIRITNNSPSIYFYDSDVSGLYHRILGGGNKGLEYSVDPNNATAGYHRWDIGGSEVMRLIEGGNLGIGTTSPTRGITIDKSNGDAALNIVKNNTGNQIVYLGTGASSAVEAGILQLSHQGSVKAQIYTSGDSYFNGGNVGIGTTSPSSKLQVKGLLGIERSNTTDTSTISMEGNFIFNAASGYNYKFKSNGTDLVHFDSNGNVGIGTTSPSNKLHVSTGNNTATGFRVDTGLDNNSASTPSALDLRNVGGSVSDAVAATFNVGSADRAKIISGRYSSGGYLQIQTGNSSNTLTDRVRIDNSGNVGIGTTSPATKFEVRKDNSDTTLTAITSGNDTISLLNETDTTNNYTSIGFVGNAAEITARIASVADASNGRGNLVFLTGDSSSGTPIERMRIDSSGNVGIGTTSPLNALHVESNSALKALFTNTDFVNGSAGTSLDIGFGATSGNTYTEIRSLINGRSAWSDFVLARGGGNVGIGATSLSQKITIGFPDNGTNGLAFRSATYANLAKILVQNESSSQNGNIQFHTRNGGDIVERMRIGTSGNVGIGTTSPSYALDIERTSGEVAIQLQARDNSSNSSLYFGDNADADVGSLIYNHGSNYMAFTTNASERMRIDSSGNVLVGKTSLDDFSSAGAQIESGGQITISVAGAPSLRLNRGTNDGVLIELNRAGTTVGSIGTRSGALTVGNGDVGLLFDAVNDRIFPESISGGGSRDNAINLGTSSSRFKDLYLGGHAKIDTALTASGLIYPTSDGTINQVIATDGNGNLSFISPGAATAFPFTGDAVITGSLIVSASGATNDLQIGDDKLFVSASGNVGIGTTSPLTLLHVGGGGSSNVPITFAPSTGGNVEFRNTSSTGTFTFTNQNGVQERVRIDASGNVGIGTTSPGGRLQLDHTGAQGATALILNRSDNSTANGVISFKAQGVSKSGIGTNFNVGDANGNLEFLTNGTSTRMVIDSSGNVGIGTTSPGYKLEVNGNAEFLNNVNIKNNSYDDYQIAVDSVGFSIYNRTDAVYNMTIDHTGNVGIGTTSPGAKLHVSGTLADNREFQVGGDYLVVTGSTGYVGIGTANPDHSLHIEDEGDVMLQLKATDSNQAYMKFVNSTTGDGKFTDGLLLGVDTDESVVFWNYEATAARFATSGTERMRIESGGALTFSTISSVTSTAASISHLSTNNYLYIKGGTAGLVIGDDTTASRIQIEDNSNIRFETAGSEALRITAANRVGIGTTSPDQLLHLQSTSATGAILNLETTHGGGIPIYNMKGAHSAQLRYQDENGVNHSRIDFTDSGSFSFIDATNGTSHLYIAPTTGNATFAGDVTITGGDLTLGTDSIASNINAVGDVLAFKVDSNENTGGTPNIQFKVGAATELTIDGSTATFAGDIDLTAGQLELRGDVALDHDGSSLYVKAPSSIFFYPGNSNKANINSSGNFTLAGNLDINGTGTSTIAGDLTVGGKVTAQEFHTEFVSASIIYQSGSTKFGDTSDDVHSFSGSLRVTGSGDHYFTDGRLGIGTTEPGTVLDIHGTGNVLHVGTGTNTAQYMSFRGSGASGAYIGYDGTGMMLQPGDGKRFLIRAGHATFSSGTAALAVDTSGNVGIGTTSPDNKLVVADSNGAGLEIIPQTSNDRTTLLSYDRNASTYQTLDFDSSDVHFNIAGSEKMRMDSSGNVLIGKTASSGVATGNIEVSNSSSASVQIEGGTHEWSMLVSSAADALRFFQDSTERMRINSSGNVLIGTTTAQSGTKLQVAGVLDVWSSTNTLLRFNHDGTRGIIETFTGGNYSNTAINPNGGNVGIGTTTPDAFTKLTVAGAMTLTGQNTGHGASRIKIGQDTSAISQIRFYGADASTRGILQFIGSSSDGAVGTENMRIHSNGNVGIGTTSPDAPLQVAAGTSLPITTAGTGTISFGSISSTSTPTIMGRQTSNTVGLYLLGSTTDANSNGDMVFNVRENNNSTFATLTNPAFKFSHFSTELVTILRNGNVGVGTTSPAPFLSNANAAVDVGNSNGGEFVARRSGGEANLAMGVTGGNIGYLYSTTNTPMVFGVNNAERVRIDTSGNVGMNAIPENSSGTWRNYQLGSLSMAGRASDVNPDAMFGTNFKFTTANAEQRISAHATSRLFFNDDVLKFQNAGSGTAGSAISWNDRFIINSSGRVGIGESTPLGALHIKVASDTSDIQLESSGGSGRRYEIQSRTDGSFTIFDGTGSTERMRIDSSGNVGIGETNPQYPLSIEFADSGTSQQTFKGLILANSNSTVNNGAAIAFSYGGSSANSFARMGAIHSNRSSSSETTHLFFGTIHNGSYGERMRIDSSGNVGIGTTSPSTALEVNGTATVTSLVETSTRKLKEDIETLEDQSSIVDSLQPVSYTWKESKEEDFGLVAEDVADIAPHLVSRDEDGNPTGIKYSKLSVLLLDVVQRQSTLIEDLNERITKLENERGN